MKITLASLIILFAIHHDSSNAGARKERYENPNAPAVNLDFWSYDPDGFIFRFVSSDGLLERKIDAKRLTPDDRDFLKHLVALPDDHAIFLISIFQTGCKDWRNGAIKKVNEWNKSNPDKQIMLK